MPVPSLRAQRAAVTALFALDGLVFGSWATRIPDIAAQVGAGPAALGLLLLCVSVGALGSMQVTGVLCERLGAGTVGSIAAVLTSVTITVPGATGSVPELAAALLARPAATGGGGERAAGRAAWITGAVFVTEGAIPFAAADPLRVIPSIVAGSAVGGGLAMAFGAAATAPHGGVLVLPLVTNPVGSVIALGSAVAVAAALVIGLKARGARLRLGQPDEAQAGQA